MKVHVLVAGRIVPAWQLACVRALRAVDGIDVTVNVSTGAQAHAYRPRRGIAAFLSGPALAPVDIAPDAPVEGAADVVLDLARDGALPAGENVWRFRFGEYDDPASPFVREIAGGADAVEVALVRHAGGREELLRRGCFPVTRWHASTLRWSLLEAARWPAILLANAASPQESAPASAPAGTPPVTVTGRARFAFAMAKRLAGYAVESLFEMTEWNVGFADAQVDALLRGAKLDVRWLPRRGLGTFISDPFVVERDGRRVLFVEDYSYARDRGVIAALELDDAGNVIGEQNAIDLPVHLSYPYPVVVDDVLYLVPESSAANEVALYRCVEFPWRWEREAAIFPEFDGIDTTLFVHDNRWWALCCRASRGSTFALYAYHAAAPRGPWTAHPLNPVVEDVTSARPAGAPFAVDGELYRPGQNCARSYGGGLTISRIDELTPHAYRERIVRRIGADGFGRYSDGVHTMGITSRGLVLDGKRTYHDARKLFLLLRSRLHR